MASGPQGGQQASRASVGSGQWYSGQQDPIKGPVRGVGFWPTSTSSSPSFIILLSSRSSRPSIMLRPVLLPWLLPEHDMNTLRPSDILDQQQSMPWSLHNLSMYLWTFDLAVACVVRKRRVRPLDRDHSRCSSRSHDSSPNSGARPKSALGAENPSLRPTDDLVFRNRWSYLVPADTGGSHRARRPCSRRR